MAKVTKIKNQEIKGTKNDIGQKTLINNGKSEPLIIGYPLLWLILITIIVYHSLLDPKFGVTELDDTIFIRDFHDYNEHLANLFTSFHRGLFDAIKDPYYRPLFLDSMILNYWISGQGQNIFAYHIVNLLFHIVSVVLLYKLFIKLEIKALHALILTGFFAIHPVLTQAVAWIPGRNDTLLAMFIFSFLLFSIDYSKNGKVRDILLSALFLLLAFFTKETAVFAAPVALIVFIFFLPFKFTDKRNLIQYAVWIFCFAIWYLARAQATIQTSTFSTQMINDFVHRLPLIVQYIGKIFIPLNLSVFPMQEDTVYYYGIIAIILLSALIYFSPNRNNKRTLGGIIIFFLFLLPVLIVPSSLNEQTFEHRLYLPIVGIILILPQTFLFSGKFTDGQILIYSAITIAIFAGRTYNHEQNFRDPYSFWTQAVETSPHSSFANMHLSEYEDNLEKKCTLIRKAFQLNPKEKYINFFYAEMLINIKKKDSILAAEPYLLTEKGISNFYKCNFYLAQIAVERQDLNRAIEYLREFLKTTPETSKEGGEANNNLLVLYISTKQTTRVINQVKHMKELGLPVPAEVLKQYNL